MATKHTMFFYTIIGAISVLGSTALQANALWVGNTDDIFTNPDNWLNNTLPTSTTIAELGTEGTSTTLQVSTSISVLGVQFDLGAPNAYYIYNPTTDTFSIGLSGVVNNSGYTQQIANDSSGAGLILFAGGSAGNNMSYSSFNTDPGAGITFASSVDGSNSTFVAGNLVDTLTSNGDSSVGSFGISHGNVALQSGTLTSGNLNQDDYIYGIISGDGAFILSTTTNSGTLSLGGPNIYTGGTTINAFGNGGMYIISGGSLPSAGSVAVNSGGLYYTLASAAQTIGSLSGSGSTGVVSLGATFGLTVNQTTDQSYAGTLTTTGATFTLGTASSTTATGTLTLKGDSSSFAGPVIVNSGNLQVNGQLGASSISINSGGTLSGTGTFGTLGNLTTIAAGGTLAPGNSVGTVYNAGNQLFSTGSYMNVEENGSTSTPPSISLLVVTGTVTVDSGAIVNLITSNGALNFNTQQTFLETFTAAGLTVNGTGFILNSSSLPAIYNPALSQIVLGHTTTTYYLTTETTFETAVEDNGGGQTAVIIAAQLDSISDPNTVQNAILNDLAQLPTDVFINVVDDLSGGQYATEVFNAAVSNRQFIRRLYDPIRELVTTEPSDCCYAPTYPCCEFFGFDIWAEAGGGQRQVNGDLGMELSEWDVTFGIQKTFCQDWTLGIAGSYENNTLNYHSSNGHGSGYTWFGGVYGLYRPQCWYILADVAYGYTQHNTHRHLTIPDTIPVIYEFTGKPKISQVTFYAEAGFDWDLCSFMIQPFVGIEVAGFNRRSFTEDDVDATTFGLFVHKKSATTATSSLGVHLTDQFCYGFDVSIDLAWLYRFTNNYNFTADFYELPPHTDFTVYGPNVGRNSGEGAITFSKDFFDNWRVWIEASGEIWENASTYNILGGLQVTW